MGTKRKGVSVESRFWSKVEKSDGCWIWRASKLKDGYGQFRAYYRSWAAHRFAWRLEFGEIPKGLFVCHHCDTPACVRPDHLFLGTARDNNQDASTKGRSAFGDKNGTRARPETRPRGANHSFSKLDVNTAEEIRDLYFSKVYSTHQLSQMFSVSATTILNIIHNRHWTDKTICDACAIG